MAFVFSNVNSQASLQKLNDCHTCIYISGAKLQRMPWLCSLHFHLLPCCAMLMLQAYKVVCHISSLLRSSGVTSDGEDVKMKSSCSVASTPESVEHKAPAADDVGLFGEETEEECALVNARAGAVKASTGKSSALLDVKLWDDETNMLKIEEAVRSVEMEGLLWACMRPVTELKLG